MGHTTGRVSEIRMAQGGQMELLISCQDGLIPFAGQYMQAYDPDDPQAILSTSLFLAERSQHGFWASPVTPVSWQPGAGLHLQGPLGHGFDLPAVVQRLALAVLGNSASRLMPLVSQAARAHCAITMFIDISLPFLPFAVEVHPLAALKDALDWPDFMALDIPLQHLERLHGLLGVARGSRLACPAQVLLTTPMPCAGMAKCGACSVKMRRGWKLACEDGPVFDLNQLEW